MTVPRGQGVVVVALASSRLCFSALLMLSDGVISPTMHSAMSWTRASFIHLHMIKLVWAPELFGTVTEKSLVEPSTCPCWLQDRWWSETSLPCGTCDLTRSQVSSRSCKPSQSGGPSRDQVTHSKKRWKRAGKVSIEQTILICRIETQNTSFLCCKGLFRFLTLSCPISFRNWSILVPADVSVVAAITFLWPGYSWQESIL